ncbi:uncharacterized protein KY384_002683 [Bacidia gigantensis]|uniref:uncharacterized protein n=1 Tax=Bacidia gigantensis TaxID=2732470 RepID=UPI001D043EE8|nr:uncharacterized protein KY384_002683 [Bacidia gigantensis]KAG8532805.1 hypothetical protein KY384_002683 [Bacidia gigantensis]
MSSRRPHRGHSHGHRTSADRQTRAEQTLSTTQASLEDFHIGGADPVLLPYDESHSQLQPPTNRHAPDYVQTPSAQPALQDYHFDTTFDQLNLPGDDAFDPQSYNMSLSLNRAGYPHPGSELPPSRSMSGPPSHMLPSSILPSSTFEEEFDEAGREVARQRRRRIAHGRRDHKARMRRVMLPSVPEDSGSSQVHDLSGSINTFAGRSPYQSSTATMSGTASYPETLYPPTVGSHPGGPGYDHPRGGRSPPNQDPVIIEQPKKPQCWDHGCNGRTFSTFSNLLRHQREKSGSSTKSLCPRCGAEFTRKTARDGHMAHDKCKSNRRDA